MSVPPAAGSESWEVSSDTLAELRHELRTPLNQIIGYSEMLLEEAEEQGQLAFLPDLQKIHNSATNLVDLINAHLMPARLAAARHAAINLSRSASSAPPESGLKSHHWPESTAIVVRGAGSHLLIVDDSDSNRDMLRRRLERDGFVATMAASGQEALALMSRQPFDLVLLDILMPDMDGFTVLERMKRDSELRHIPVIMISALDEIEGVIRCIEIGAEDYLPKPFNPTLLRARLGACLEKKLLRDQERRTYQALVESQKQLAAELAEAAGYVKSLLPPPLTGLIQAEWCFIPSKELGGDAFGYHWLDDDSFALYLLDVCGHGVGAALLSISVMNVLRSQALPATDFRNPGAVLCALNETFPMENQNNMYFTIWYGVYHPAQRQLDYASGGHPPAVLVQPSGEPASRIKLLRTPGLVVGSMPGVHYATAQCDIPPGSKLFVLSDGTYEITLADGSMLSFEQFVEHLALPSDPEQSDFHRLLAYVQGLQGQPHFADDFSIMRIVF